MQIFFIRHVDAQPLNEVENDAERSITMKGQKKVKKCGKGIRKLGLFPERILSSPLKRALETSEGIADELGFSENVEPVEELLGDADPEELIEALREIKAEQIFLVGHQPMLGTAVSMLIGAGREGKITLKKGGLCLVDVENWNQDPPGRIRWLFTAKQLGWMGKKKKNQDPDVL